MGAKLTGLDIGGTAGSDFLHLGGGVDRNGDDDGSLIFSSISVLEKRFLPRQDSTTAWSPGS